jgi:hypothetical protein
MSKFFYIFGSCIQNFEKSEGETDCSLHDLYTFNV